MLHIKEKKNSISSIKKKMNLNRMNQLIKRLFLKEIKIKDLENRVEIIIEKEMTMIINNQEKRMKVKIGQHNYYNNK